MKYPSISIITPSLNQGKYINRTIQSVLKQEYPGEVEIIVSDGGSKDKTVEILKQYGNRIKWWSEKDDGFAHAVKKGLDAATGDIIGIQNSDDFYLKDAFSSVVQVFDENASAGVVTGSYYTVDASGNYLGRQTVPQETFGCRSVFYYPGVYQHSTFFLRRCLDPIIDDLFLIKMYGVDWELFYKILHFCTGIYVTQPIAAYSRHGDQFTQSIFAHKHADAVTQIIESCETNSRYSSRFSFSQQEKRDIFAFNSLAWGKDLLTPDKGEALLKEILENKGAYTLRTVELASSRIKPKQKNRLIRKTGKIIEKLKSLVKPSGKKLLVIDESISRELIWYQ